MTVTIPRKVGPHPGLAICREHTAPPAPGAFAAIGNFDGVHLGHQRLLEIVRDEAGRYGQPTAVLTFEPHPRDVFRPDDPAFRLTSEAVKLKLLAAFGVDIAFVRRFDAAFAATTASDFVGRLLADEMRLSGIVVGEDFHFGRGRVGDSVFLRQHGEACGLRVRIEAALEQDGAPVSSTRIRRALETGDVAVANRLLGYRWFVEGEVVHGEKRGRTLGYPTANVRLPASCRLAHGIYAVRAALGDGPIVAGVASFGRRPTFDNGAPLLETFLFDYAGDLYGRRIEVEFLGWIRGEERFASAEALVGQMDRDTNAARRMAAGGDGRLSLIG
ncbi:bifunctional riboflavin kinase/FAD synthetase [uncultured Enterovirga sp.]|uniref:bifunctional riboflavin kinase/FAD synthetase n=1 Tax=uncultured Enterovirga sp. TaxID=2026352 RepID=UPI0035CBBE7A